MVGACNSADTISHFRAYPAPQTVLGRVLGAFLQQTRLTHNTAQVRFGTSRLAAHVHRLREMGWPIQTEIIEVATHDHGRHSHIARYSLDATAIAGAGETGRLFVQSCRRIDHGQISR
jgi:hypothetical protein